jgi:purine-binding chemotaxis protein CheW
MAAGGKLLTVSASDQEFSLPVDDVVEIIRVPAISRVPHSPESLLGIANFRSVALPIISLSHLLGKGRSVHRAETRVVVVDSGTRAGVLVDGVGAVSDATDNEVLDLRALLDRDYSARQRKFTGRVSTVDGGGAWAVDVSQVDEDRKAFIGFEVAQQQYALPLSEVHAIIALPDAVTAVPRADGAMLGVIEIAHDLVPLVSLRVLLGLPQSATGQEKAHVAVVKIAGKLAGLVVDSVQSILRVPKRSIDDVPSVLSRGKGEAAISAICRLESGKLISVLAVDRLFDPETTRRLAASATPTGEVMSTIEDSDALEQFVIFELGGERYGLPISAVDEIVRRPRHLTRVPHAPPFVDGIMNLRGKMIPVIDQRKRFAVEGEADKRVSRVIILTVGGLQTGFTVDNVSEILSLRQSELKPAPEMKSTGAVVDKVAVGHGHGDIVLLIDPTALLNGAERDILASLQSGNEGQRE